MISLEKDEEVEEVTADVDGWTEVRTKHGMEGLVQTDILGRSYIIVSTKNPSF